MPLKPRSEISENNIINTSKSSKRSTRSAATEGAEAKQTATGAVKRNRNAMIQANPRRDENSTPQKSSVAERLRERDVMDKMQSMFISPLKQLDGNEEVDSPRPDARETPASLRRPQKRGRNDGENALQRSFVVPLAQDFSAETLASGDRKDEAAPAPLVCPLGTEVMQHLERLLGPSVRSIALGQPRYYAENEYPIPESMQYFLDMPWSDDFCFKSAEYFLDQQGTFSEYALEKEDLLQYEWLINHPDHMLISYGEVMIACLMKDEQQNMADWNIYIIDDTEADAPVQVEGPYILSRFLATVQPIQNPRCVIK